MSDARRRKKTKHKASARREAARSTGEKPRRAKRAPRRDTTRATRTSAHEAATAKPATQRARRIDVVLKGLTVAAEPPIDANPGDLDLAFRNKLQAVLAKLASAGTPFRLVEGFRTRARQ